MSNEDNLAPLIAQILSDSDTINVAADGFIYPGFAGSQNRREPFWGLPHLAIIFTISSSRLMFSAGYRRLLHLI
jgi:hypothetical protein